MNYYQGPGNLESFCACFRNFASVSARSTCRLFRFFQVLNCLVTGTSVYSTSSCKALQLYIQYIHCLLLWLICVLQIHILHVAGFFSTLPSVYRAFLHYYFKLGSLQFVLCFSLFDIVPSVSCAVFVFCLLVSDYSIV